MLSNFDFVLFCVLFIEYVLFRISYRKSLTNVKNKDDEADIAEYALETMMLQIDDFNLRIQRIEENLRKDIADTIRENKEEIKRDTELRIYNAVGLIEESLSQDIRDTESVLNEKIQCIEKNLQDMNCDIDNTVNHLRTFVKDSFDETTEEITTMQKNINILYKETESHDVQILDTITDTINLVFESKHYPKSTERMGTMMSQRREITELQAGIREVTADLANIWRIIQIPKHMMHLRPNCT